MSQILTLTALLVISFYVTFSSSISIPKYDKLLVFGDSYSDDGNVYKLSNGTWPPPFYFKGGFSNGPLWTAFLSQSLSAQLENYAYGGATADDDFIQGYSGADGTLKVPGLKRQVEAFSAKLSNGTDLSHSLAVVWLIGNDYLNTNWTAAPSNVIARSALSWYLLYQKGVRNFLLPNMPDVSLFPYFKGSDPSYLAIIKDVYQKNNAELKKSIDTFKQAKPDVKVYDFQTDQFWVYYRQVQASRLGVTDFVDACASTYENKPLTICSNPDSYFYWDDFHPEAKTEQALAAAFYASLGN
ncbi:2125_t:CDS:2 [Ambispora leptoticha]|uniref:2125_t:CDS:1 n=1 Tax=Ambispora leptoticha TaxID=144679 RepID=A0A9N8VYP7_9GLOM|nr:2125_t:CDS:2 [Ambispora leptoticha]